MENTAVVPSSVAPAPASSAFGRYSPRAIGMLMIGAVAAAAVVTAAWLWSTAPIYRVLFTNLSDRDGGAIIAQLSQMNIPYRNNDGGTILVPQERVHEARLKLASQGLPKGSVVGFEIMESQKLGTTQFQEQVNYQRALEGELSRSIQALAPVANARVHLALPKQSGFLRDKQPPTASVLIQLHGGKTLDRAQVAGIVHLVSSSVPELAPKNVSVVDQHGTLMASSRDGSAAGLDAAQLDYVARVESETIRRIEDILEPIVGRGNVRAQVTADVDFTQTENVAETYAPNQGTDTRVAVRSQSTQESATPSSSALQGIPGALSNQAPLPPTAPINAPPGTAAAAGAAPPTAAAGGNSTRRDAVTNFEVDKTVRHTRVASGQIKRLTAAVVVNHKGAGAGATPTALSEQEMNGINALVREAMGYNKERGDSINVVNAPFSTIELGPAEPLPFWKQPDVIALASEVGKAALFLVLASLIIFGVLRPALAALTRPAPVPATAMEVQFQPQLGGPELEPGLPAPANPISLTSIEQVRQLATNDPATVANVVKAWVGEGKS